MTSSLRNLVTVTLLSAASAVVYGADTEGQYAIKGLGLASCSQFLEAQEAQSNKYSQFGGWINGYLSATNRYIDGTFDIAPWQSTGMLAGWLTRYCQQDPDVKFVRALAVLVNALEKDRLMVRSELVQATAGETTLYLYEATLLRAQRRLLEDGQYDVAVTGAFDDQTRQALALFQRAIGLPETGLPDQATLARLLEQAAERPGAERPETAQPETELPDTEQPETEETP